MLSLQERIDLSDLSEEEVEEIAEHERVPAIVAAEFGNTLLRTKAGVCLMKLYLLENLERARLLGQFDKASRLDSLCRRLDRKHFGVGPAAAEPLLH